MASPTDVRAGRAYVELGTQDRELNLGLKKGLAKVKKFAEEASSIARSVALFGIGAATGLGATLKFFGDAGSAAARLQKQTGLTADAISGLARAAADNDVPFQALTNSITIFQKKIVKGGADTADALSELGLKMSDVRKMKFDEVIGLIANRLPLVQDEAKRTSLAVALFGKSGTALLPVLAGGASGLDAAAAAAARAGDAFDDDTLAASARLDDAFDELTATSKGLRNALGVALADAVLPLINGISGAIQAVSAWIRENPKLAQGIFNITLAVTVLAAATVALTGAVILLLNPITWIVTAFVAVASSALAVTDALGITSTGFGELFNSVRIGGQGLATWLAKFWTFVVQGFENVKLVVTTGFDAWWTIATAAVRGIYNALSKLIRPVIDLFKPLFDWLSNAFDKAFEYIAAGVRKLIGWFNTATSWIWGKSKQLLDSTAAPGETTFSQRLAERQAAAEKNIELQQKRRAELDIADPKSGSGISFDSSRARAGIEQIGASIGNLFSAALSSVSPSTAPVDRPSPFSGTDVSQVLKSLTPALSGSARRVDVLGTFNAGVSSRIGFGSSLDERQARAAEATAANTRAILDELRNGGAAFQ